ncbi:MAG: hypothetical protein A2Y12_18540 [Planctomycetes bacterium GWF2_42_9]|nr:MAG: hypothetical protein A2Y12_18540 [Planctomycetes bacterium GWF2_42_9]
MGTTQDYSSLIGQLASAITIAEVTDSGELKSIQDVLEKIRESIDSTANISPDLVNQAGHLTLKASETLGTIINNSCSDAKSSLESVTKCVCELQHLIETGLAGSESNTPAPQSQETMISGDDVALVQDFITESREHIENAEAGLLKLENDASDTEAINLIFRAFHTIKGMAGFLNLKEIQSLSHSAENLLDKARKGTLVLQGQSMDAVFASLDALKKMVSGLKESIDSGKPVHSHPNLDSLLSELACCSEGKQAEKQNVKPAVSDVIQPMDQDTAETVNSQQPHLDVSQVSTSPANAAAAAKPCAAAAEDKVKVSLARLDTLVNMVGELVIAQSMVGQQVLGQFPPEHNLSRKVSHQGKIIRELQELSMTLRMVPIHGIFQKMARLVRDLSHKANKNVIFETSGEETEIDRNIVDSLSDPLVHMIRNSVDHGIEDTQSRRTAGKGETGKVTLKAFHKGGNIVIELTDDGRGLNKDKILKKAIDAGLVSHGQELSDQEIFKLIFHAGLSTAEKVTDISGRGVGMDVVRKNIESLRGKIEIVSEVGKGTTFSIKLPLTLAIIDGQLVRVGKQTYIIPILSIEHSLRPSESQLSTVQGRGEIVNIRGELLPLVRMHNLFKVSNAIEEATKASLVIIEGDSRKCALMVDELLGQQQVVIKNLGEGIGNLKGISGAAIMGDGNISLILDTPGIMQLAWS